MVLYYTVPVRREKRTLSYNPFDSRRALAATPHDAAVQLGASEVGSLFTVWPLNRKVDVEEASNACSLMAPVRIFIMIDPAESVFLPLDPTIDLTMGAFGAGCD